MMNTTVLKTIIIGSLLSLCCSASMSQGGQGKSDREKDGFRGPVSSVKVEAAWLELKDGKLVETDRRLTGEVRYDRPGARTYSEWAPEFGDPKSASCVQRYTYDKKGREKEYYNSCISADRAVTKYSYEDDQSGNWIKKLASFFNKKSGKYEAGRVEYREITYYK